MHLDHAALQRRSATSHGVPRGRRLAAHLVVGAMVLAGSIAAAAPVAAAPAVVAPAVVAPVAGAVAVAPALASAPAANKPVLRRTASMSYFLGEPPAGMPGLASAEIVQDVRAKTLTAKPSRTVSRDSRTRTGRGMRNRGGSPCRVGPTS